MEEKTTETNEVVQATPRRKFSGVVVSNRMKDTIVVAVTRYVKHPKYKKYIKHVKRYKAHDENNTKQIGDSVLIEETRPLSRDKRHRVV